MLQYPCFPDPALVHDDLKIKITMNIKINIKINIRSELQATWRLRWRDVRCEDILP